MGFFKLNADGRLSSTVLEYRRVHTDYRVKNSIESLPPL
jgi:hypothetical protein